MNKIIAESPMLHWDESEKEQNRARMVKRMIDLKAEEPKTATLVEAERTWNQVFNK